MTMQLLSLVCCIAAMFGDTLRIKFARMLVDYLNTTAQAQIPNSEVFNPENEKVTAGLVQMAMDAVDLAGRRGGWKAGQKVVAAARTRAKPFLVLPDPIAITILLGMRGDYTPLTSFAAYKLLNDIKQQYHDTGKPNFLFQTAHKEAVEKLKAADNQPGYLGSGCLKKIFELRKENPNGLTTRAREKAVLLYFQQSPEYRKFLGRDKDENFVLPIGTDYESFARSMLVNAYGPVPSGAWNAADDDRGV